MRRIHFILNCFQLTEYANMDVKQMCLSRCLCKNDVLLPQQHVGLKPYNNIKCHHPWIPVRETYQIQFTYKEYSNA